MIGRLLLLMRQLLISVDQFAQVAIIGVFYVLHLTDACPSADETISSYVGRAAIAERGWALIAEHVIDGLFILLGEDPGHCRRNVETASNGHAPTA